MLTQDDRDAIVRLVGELDARWSEPAAPAADLPATLSSVDDVRRVCEAAGLEWADVKMISVAHVERQRAERAEAFREARKLLWTVESEVEDVLVVADWLLTGRATLALEFSAQMARNYAQNTDREMPDAATWAPLDDEQPMPEWERELLAGQEPSR